MTLEKIGIDPFTIFLQALLLKMKEKISRIEFIGVDIEEFAKKTPVSRADDRKLPIHFRQYIWLMENADKMGYQRQGNSWILLEKK